MLECLSNILTEKLDFCVTIDTETPNVQLWAYVSLLIKKNERSNVLWGSTRSIINSALIGVSSGHEKILELNGVGFRANMKGELLNLQLGFSHDVTYKIPKDIKISIEKSTTIKINGIDKEVFDIEFI